MKTLIKMFALCSLIFFASCSKDNPVIDIGTDVVKKEAPAECEFFDILTNDEVMAIIEKARNTPPKAMDGKVDYDQFVFVYLMGDGFVVHSSEKTPDHSFSSYGEFDVEGTLGEGHVIIEHEQGAGSRFIGRMTIDLGDENLLLKDNPGSLCKGRSKIVRGLGTLDTVQGSLQRYIYEKAPESDDLKDQKGIALFGWLLVNS